MAFFSFTNLGLLTVGLYLAYYTHWQATIGSRRRALQKEKGCLPPKSYPGKFLGIPTVLGNLKAVAEHRQLARVHHHFREMETGTYSFSWVGGTVFQTNDPEVTKSMLATEFQSFSIGSMRTKEAVRLLGRGIFTTEGKEWKHSREMLRPCFERSQVSDVAVFEKHIQELIKRVPVDGSTVDLSPLFHEFTMDVASEFLFGESTGCLGGGKVSQEVGEFMEAFVYCFNPLDAGDGGWMGWAGLVWRMVGLPDRRLERAVERINAFADNLVEKRIKHHSQKQTTDRYVFLDTLIDQTTDRIKIRSELLNILLAGRDTTAALLSNLFFELARRPPILSRLRAEISEHIGPSDTPSWQQLKDLKYLHAIINESLRLYPIAPANSREAIADVVLPVGGGDDGKAPLFVQKGRTVIFFSYSMHRREDVFGEDAEEFRPERWVGEGLRPGWGFLPFLGGPRGCIGQQFALTEVAYVTVRLLQAFGEIESRDSEPWREKMTVTVSGLGGCKVAVRE